MEEGRDKQRDSKPQESARKKGTKNGVGGNAS